MKNKIFTGWSIIRVFQLLIGCTVIFQSVVEKQWLGILFGSYFAAMGLFGFGCASGNCSIQPAPKSPAVIQDVDFEEVKTK